MGQPLREQIHLPKLDTLHENTPHGTKRTEKFYVVSPC